MDAGTFVGILFLARGIAHREHLKTRSYAKHKALEEFYSEIVDLADSFAESYQGCYNELLDIPLLNNEFEGDVVEVIRQQMEWIEENRGDFCPRDNTALQNIVDEIVSLYHSTLYKLRFLS